MHEKYRDILYYVDGEIFRMKETLADKHNLPWDIVTKSIIAAFARIHHFNLAESKLSAEIDALDKERASSSTESTSQKQADREREEYERYTRPVHLQRLEDLKTFIAGMAGPMHMMELYEITGFDRKYIEELANDLVALNMLEKPDPDDKDTFSPTKLALQKTDGQSG